MEPNGIYELILDDIKETRQLPKTFQLNSEDITKAINTKIIEIYEKIKYLDKRPCRYYNTYNEKTATLEIVFDEDSYSMLSTLYIYANPNRKSDYSLKNKLITIEGIVYTRRDFETLQEYKEEDFYMLIHNTYLDRNNEYQHIKNERKVPFDYTILVEVLHNFLC